MMNVAALALTNLKNIIIAIPPKDSHGTRVTIPKRGGDGSRSSNVRNPTSQADYLVSHLWNIPYQGTMRVGLGYECRE